MSNFNGDIHPAVAAHLDRHAASHLPDDTKPADPLSLGVKVGDTFVDKLLRGEPTRPLVIEVDGYGDPLLDPFTTGLNVALGVETLNTTPETYARRITELTGQQVVIEPVDDPSRLSPEELSALTPTHPDIAELGYRPGFPAVRIVPLAQTNRQ